MCQETHFDYDKCEHWAPRPARTTKCALAKWHRQCHTNKVLMKLSSKKYCPQCSPSRNLRKSLVGYMRKQDMDSSGDQESGVASQDTVMEDADEGPHGTQVPPPTPEEVEEPVQESILQRCSTWPSSESRPDQPEEIEWHIPTKCFIDIGFVRLDPWAADREKLRLEAEARLEQARCEQGAVVGRSASLPDLQEISQKFSASSLFGHPEPVPSIGACCMAKKRRLEARGPQAEAVEAGREHTSDDERNTDDWCTSKF